MAVVLFTDLVGSTELRGRLGEDAAEELRRKHDQVLTRAVEAHSGRVVKGLGDGIMATFAGASDAVDAAVAIQQAVDRLNRSGKAAVPLAVRVGLSAGDVTFDDDDVHGTPVIEASRLCGAAAGGEILAADLVRALAGSSTEVPFASVGPLELKGLAQPVQAVRVAWEPLAVSTVPLPALLTDMGRIFVGRDAELERLTQLWKEATAGERRVALLAGEPGVGKTRLAAELATRVHDKGATVLAGRCDEDLGVPYQPFVEALRHFVDHTPASDLKERLGRYGGELVRLVPELRERADVLPAPLQSDPETERYRLFDAVAAWLSATSLEAPLLLVLDDLQWAAKPTVLLLRHVVRASEAHLLLLGTYRDTELSHDHPLVELVGDLRRLGGVGRLSLSGLDDVGVAALVEQASGRTLDEDGVALARAIYEETEGNPFFVREVLRHLAETGAVQREEGGWATRTPVEELGIPEGVRDVVGRRLSRLAEATNQVLRVAAVVGSEFEVPVVQEAGRFDEEALLGALEEAAGARLVVEASPTRYRFGHALVRAALYDDLTAARRVALHRRVAEAVEICHAAALDDYLPALAHHWARASAPAADTARAVEYATRAGDRALAQLAHDEAATYYAQAIELLDAAGAPGDDPHRVEVLISLGEAQRRAGQPVFRDTLLEAARVAQERGDATALARAALANSRGFFSVAAGVDAERVTMLEAALNAVGSADSEWRARLLANLVAELTYATEPQRVRRLAAEALAMARRLGDPATLAHVIATSSLHLAPSPDADARAAQDEMRERLTELRRLAARLENPVLEFWAASWGYLRSLTVGDMGAYQRQLEEADQLAAELQQPFLRWLVLTGQSARSRLAGRLEEAEALAGEALQLGETTGIPDAFRFYGANLFWIRYDQGRLGEVLQLLERAATRPGANAVVVLSFAEALCEVDRSQDAHPLLESVAADDFAAVPVNFAWIWGLAMATDVCARLHDLEHAATLHRHLAPHADLFAVNGTTAAIGSVAHYLGLLATTLGCLDDAEEHFVSAAAAHERISAPTLLARTRLEWARMLLTRRRPGDGDRARELLGQALDSARELGLGGVERQAIALLGELP